ncbi:MAG: hypothetical protein HF314_01295 [Ignavibacteria bacterium]|jgi:hypothetical protein|nr:hypothetical protein [Ignavibacteria bacterium]MCU7501677.1 hypothetical protein [Ignavibacteria bacterium]MCU7517734.1 hypothetical protein [Ignavibacteria bacterium]
MKLALLACLAFLLQFNPIYAQSNPETQNPESKAFSCWTQAGLGFSSANFQETKAGLLLGLGATVKTGNDIFSFRFNRNSELNILGAEPAGEIWTLEALYGKSFAFKTNRLIFPLFPLGLFFKGDFSYMFNVSAGISYVGLKERGDIINREIFNETYSARKTSKFGVPIELELMNIISRNISVGTGIYSNINGKKNFLGARCNFNVGIF